MSDNEGAFVRAFRAEMAEAQHQALVELYTRANRVGFGVDPALRERAEGWAKDVEASGKAQEVLRIAAEAQTCSECGR